MLLVSCQASTTQENINTAADDMRDVVQDLLHMLEDSVSQAGEVTTMIDKISKSISRVIYVDLDMNFNVDLEINFNVDLDIISM